MKTGRRVGNLVEIISGIEPNQQLVATGGAFLSDNDLVKIAPQANTKNKSLTISFYKDP